MKKLFKLIISLSLTVAVAFGCIGGPSVLFHTPGQTGAASPKKTGRRGWTGSAGSILDYSKHAPYSCAFGAF